MAGGSSRLPGSLASCCMQPSLRGTNEGWRWQHAEATAPTFLDTGSSCGNCVSSAPLNKVSWHWVILPVPVPLLLPCPGVTGVPAAVHPGSISSCHRAFSSRSPVLLDRLHLIPSRFQKERYFLSSQFHPECHSHTITLDSLQAERRAVHFTFK